MYESSSPLATKCLTSPSSHGDLSWPAVKCLNQCLTRAHFNLGSTHFYEGKNENVLSVISVLPYAEGAEERVDSHNLLAGLISNFE